MAKTHDQEEGWAFLVKLIGAKVNANDKAGVGTGAEDPGQLSQALLQFSLGALST
jgi:hypothetical protein